MTSTHMLLPFVVRITQVCRSSKRPFDIYYYGYGTDDSAYAPKMSVIDTKLFIIKVVSVRSFEIMSSSDR